MLTAMTIIGGILVALITIGIVVIMWEAIIFLVLWTLGCGCILVFFAELTKALK